MGNRSYEYARAGITVEREARPITIFELNFIKYQAPFLTLEVHCSKGTYIRTLVDDLGEVLGCGAHVTVFTSNCCCGLSNRKDDDMGCFAGACRAR